MYRIVLLCVCVVVALAQGPDRKCMKLMHRDNLACCKNNPPAFDNDEDIKECFQIEHKPHSCDREICIGVKKGIASPDGAIDKNALMQSLGKLLEGEPAFFDSLKTQCIDGDLTKYGPPDSCDLLKLKNCMKTHYIQTCQDWDDSGSCKGINDLVTECKTKLV